jgi:hypothetical protein
MPHGQQENSIDMDRLQDAPVSSSLARVQVESIDPYDLITWPKSGQVGWTPDGNGVDCKPMVVDHVLQPGKEAELSSP